MGGGRPGPTMGTAPTRRTSATWVLPAVEGPQGQADEPLSPGLLPKAPRRGLNTPGAGFLAAPSPRGPPCQASEAVAAPVAEGRLGELQHAGPGLVEELGGAAQQPLSLRERLRQLLLPLHKLGVALAL